MVAHAHQKCEGVHARHFPEHLEAAFAVAADASPFFGGQGCGLGENIVGHGEDADVVHHQCQGERNHILVGVFQVGGHE